eukprot:1336852-Amorphochlora_amoeboformis.AAC.1
MNQSKSPDLRPFISEKCFPSSTSPTGIPSWPSASNSSPPQNSCLKRYVSCGSHTCRARVGHVSGMCRFDPTDPGTVGWMWKDPGTCLLSCHWNPISTCRTCVGHVCSGSEGSGHLRAREDWVRISARVDLGVG